MLMKAAEVMELKRWILTVPFLTPTVVLLLDALAHTCVIPHRQEFD